MSHPIKMPRKLIEVALPLDSINAACAREKSIRHGHPSTLHLWWARRPLAAARAVLFAQLVNDPLYQQGGGFKYGKNKKEAALERKRLFQLMEELVLWENTTNEQVLKRAMIEIKRSWEEVCNLNKDHPDAATLFNPDKLPAFHDPFAGGGAIPIEAQRLGLESYASDLNPVAVIINKAMIEIPPKFAGCHPIGPIPNDETQKIDIQANWPGSTGLAEDVRRYGIWLRNEAQNRIGYLYPPVTITEMISKGRPDLTPLLGKQLTVIAWIWARTVKSPNPAYSSQHVPLTSTFILSSREANAAYVVPIVAGSSFHFEVRTGLPDDMSVAKIGTKLARGANFRCLLSNSPIQPSYIKAEGIAGRMGSVLMAVVAEGPRGRVYLPATKEMQELAQSAKPNWQPDIELPNDLRNFWTLNYGLTKFGHLFSSRQLVALNTFSSLIGETREKIYTDAIASGMIDDGATLDTGGTGARAYADAVSVYLACSLSKGVNMWSSLCFWMNDRGAMRETMARQSLPMIWDYAEANPFSSSGGNYLHFLNKAVMAIEFVPSSGIGFVNQADAQTQNLSMNKIVSTDPPYYDNIGYADLSDFFYSWLRPVLRSVFPSLFSTMAVPKAEELVAAPHRHGSKQKAEQFFLEGMTQAMHQIEKQAHPAFPITIYYAFKQSDTDADSDTSSTGWVTFLEAVKSAGLQVSGTWPMRTEQAAALKSKVNSLASSIILVCRKRPLDAPSVSRREFLRELNAVLPDALDEMIKGVDNERSPVAPVDLSQAIIGPGMSVFSKYSSVLEADGTSMTVRTALQLINRYLAQDDFDRDTQFCLHWFEQYGWKEGRFGDADTLARAKGTSVDGVRDAGVLNSGGGIVRLRKWSEYPSDWNPETDTRNPIWETLHHLIRALRTEGEVSAGRLLSLVKSKSEATRQLAYRLYTLCEREGWADDARAYNELITSWTSIESAANSMQAEKQLSVFE